MEPVFELTIELPGHGSRDLLRSLHGQLREAILGGRLAPGQRLPSSRQLAQALGISRNTAVAAYDLLLSEGYAATRVGGGTFVAAVAPKPRRGAGPDEDALRQRLNPHWREALPMGADARRVAFDFGMGLPDKREFPFEVWRRLAARTLRMQSKEAASYGDAAGRAPLRAAIAHHVSFARSVACEAEDVVVTAGAQQAFDLLARVLVTPDRTVVALEDPGYPRLRAAFAAAGARLEAVPVDGEGLLVERLPNAARVVCVTPSHQFPLGTAMSLPRRKALLEWARRHGAVVIEDDYDGEFRYGGRPLDALQTLDREQAVFYVGTFSKSLFPDLRLGYVVAPAWARDALLAAKQAADGQCPPMAQDTLAAFIAEGHLARHVRRMRHVYGERRQVLLQALARHGDGHWQILPAESGIHLAVALRRPWQSRVLAERALEAGIRVEVLDRYAFGDARPNALGFGFGMIGSERIEPALRRLAGLLR